MRTIRPLLLSALLLPAVAQSRVVINEVFYNAPEDVEDLEYIELYNSAAEAVDLSGWSFTKGIKFKFPAGTRIASNGYLLLCRNRERFAEFYDAPVAGVFDQKLSNDGERLEVSDANGKVVDALAYTDSAPWPLGADGLSASLERICPDAPADDVSNWASSSLSPNRMTPAGTPGRVNDNFSEKLPPVIANVTFRPESPRQGEAIVVIAEVRDPDGPAEVLLLYRLVSPGRQTSESAIPMTKNSEGRYAGSIPGQEKEQLIRFRIRASNAKGAQRHFPSETDPRPAMSVFVPGEVEPAKIPFAWIINTTESEVAQSRARSRGGGGRFDADEMARMQARMMLENGIDLQGAWFELTAARAIDLPGLRALKPHFATKLSERDKLIDETTDSADIQAKLRRLPEIIATFQSNLVHSLQPHLAPEQNKVVAEWLDAKKKAGGGRGGMPFQNPVAMIKMMINVEAAWYAVSARAEVDGSRLANLRTNFIALVKERNELADEAGAAMQRPDGFRDVMGRVESFDDALAARLKPMLTAAQEKQLQDWRNSREMFGPRRRPSSTRNAPSHLSAFIYFDPATRKFELFDFVQVAPRSGGQKVRFYKDKPLQKMTTINLLFEDDRAVLAEPLAYEVYRRAGMAVEQSFHIRLWQNGQPLGFYALVEQPNRAFLRRNRIKDDGNLYKLLWYERGVVGQHEKKTNVRQAHDDIVDVVGLLEKNKGDALWEVIRKHFDVEQVATYFAVNSIISHWDGFFNNYFTYHDITGTGKWTMYPWDQDKTWGIHDGDRREIFYDLPLTFGMEGDAPPGESRAPRRGGSTFGRGGPAWWRPPGFFSGPLLANPQFRKIFLTRIKEILDTVYTEQAFKPVLESLEDRLRPEIKIRAEILKEDPARALERFERHLQSLRDHIKLRREFLLSQDELKTVLR